MVGADDYVQMPSDGPGKRIDNLNVATPAGPTIYRQRIALADPEASAIQELNANLRKLVAIGQAVLLALGGDQITDDDYS